MVEINFFWCGVDFLNAKDDGQTEAKTVGELEPRRGRLLDADIDAGSPVEVSRLAGIILKN